MNESNPKAEKQKYRPEEQLIEEYTEKEMETEKQKG